MEKSYIPVSRESRHDDTFYSYLHQTLSQFPTQKLKAKVLFIYIFAFLRPSLSHMLS